MRREKAVRLTEKVRLAPGRSQFVTIPRSGNRYLWDGRPGVYFVAWWEGARRRRERAGWTPAEALEALRRKRLRTSISGQRLHQSGWRLSLEGSARVRCAQPLSRREAGKRGDAMCLPERVR